MGRYLDTEEEEGLERWMKKLLHLASQCQTSDDKILHLLGYIESAEMFLDEEAQSKSKGSK